VEDLSQETKTCMMGGMMGGIDLYDARYRPSPHTSGPPIYATSHKANSALRCTPPKLLPST
jgi:hypothetical protein